MDLMSQGHKFNDIDEMDLTGYLALMGREEARKDPLYGMETIDEVPFFSIGAM